MYHVETRDCKGDGAVYHVATRHKVVPLVQGLLEHGRRTYGDKIVSSQGGSVSYNEAIGLAFGVEEHKPAVKLRDALRLLQLIVDAYRAAGVAKRCAEAFKFNLENEVRPGVVEEPATVDGAPTA